MEQINLLNQTSALLIILFLSFVFIFFGILYSRKYRGINNYLVANRAIGTFSLTTSIVASALGAWILIGRLIPNFSSTSC